MTQTATHRPPAELFSTGTSWLTRAVLVSAFLHVVVAVIWWQLRKPDDETPKTTVDIELAPPPPKVEALPEEVAKAPQSAPAAQQTGGTEEAPPEEDVLAAIDAGVDAPVDAAIDAPAKKRKRPDAALVAEGLDDAGIDGGDDGGTALAVDPGLVDAGVELGGDAGLVAATESGSGTGSGVGMGSGSDGSGVAAATETGSGSGTPGMDNQPAVAGAPTSAGTAANLLAYFPAGHQVTALIRFDRLRKTEWAAPAERLFKPMPDYKVLFGARDAGVADKFDTLVISSPRPEDATATTLVVRSALTRPKLRDYLANAATPITWTVAKGGMYGKRSGKLFNGDKRVLLSPWRNWIVLAHPDDLPGLTGASKGVIDTVETKAALPPWLQTIRTIEAESGDDKEKGPALVLTLAGPGHRYDIPDIGLGITSLPSPQRISLALELVDQGGWFIRGNIVFANEADAKEFEQAVRDVQQKIVDSRILSALLKRQHALNAVKNLSVARAEARVSYATSVSIADMRAVMAAAAATLDGYFAGQQQQPP